VRLRSRFGATILEKRWVGSSKCAGLKKTNKQGCGVTKPRLPKSQGVEGSQTSVFLPNPTSVFTMELGRDDRRQEEVLSCDACF
jgi:hypothetical protein